MRSIQPAGATVEINKLPAHFGCTWMVMNYSFVGHLRPQADTSPARVARSYLSQ